MVGLCDSQEGEGGAPATVFVSSRKKEVTDGPGSFSPDDQGAVREHGDKNCIFVKQ